MIIKLGKENKIPGEERKREKPHYAYLSAAFLLIYITISVVAFSKFNTSWDAKDIPHVLICAFASMVPISLCVHFIPKDQYQRHIYFKIHKYDRWIHSESKYKTFYIKEEVSLNSRFMFHWHMFDYKEEMNEKELEEFCKNMASSHYDDFVGFNSQEEAMFYIFREVNSLIKSEKTNQKILVKNVDTLESFTYQELKEKLENSSIEDVKKDLLGNDEE